MNETLTNRQIAFLIFGIVVGYGIINLPKNVAESAGTAGWIALLMSTLIALIFTYLITYLGYIHKGKMIYEYSSMLVGKFMTFIFMLFYIFYFFSAYTLTLRISCEIIKITVLKKTPIWALSLLFLLIMYYAVTKGLRVVARLCELYGVVIILAFIFIIILMFTGGELINLRPFFGAGGIMTYVKSLGVTTISFMGFEVIAIVAINNKNGKKVYKYTTGMMLFIGLLYILTVEAAIAVVGIDDIIYTNTALLYSVRKLDIEYLEFFRRLDGIFLIVWIMSIFTTITVFAYGCTFLISKLLNRINFNLIALIVVILSYISALIPRNAEDVQRMLGFIAYLGLPSTVIIPIILFIVTKVKKRGKEAE